MSDSPKKKSKPNSKFKYSEYGKECLENSLERIKQHVFKAAEALAASKSKNSPIEVSNEHFDEALDYIIKTKPRTKWYWFWRFLLTLCFALGLHFCIKGFIFPQTIMKGNETYFILAGFILMIVATLIDVVILDKKG